MSNYITASNRPVLSQLIRLRSCNAVYKGRNQKASSLNQTTKFYYLLEPTILVHSARRDSCEYPQFLCPTSLPSVRHDLWVSSGTPNPRNARDIITFGLAPATLTSGRRNGSQ